MHGCMYGWMYVWMDVRTYTYIYLCIIRTYLCLHHFPMVILATGGQHGIYPASSASSSGVLWLASSLVRSTLDRISARRLSMGRDVLLGDGVGIESRNIPWNIDESIVILSPISSFNLSNTRFNEDHGGNTRSFAEAAPSQKITTEFPAHACRISFITCRSE